MDMLLPRRRFMLVVICLGVLGTGMAIALLIGQPFAERTGSAAVVTPQVASDLTFETANGDIVSLADFRGKAILLNIWATWCPPCREEMPALDRLQAELGGSDFQVVTLSVDRNGLDAVRSFFAEIGIQNLDIYLDQPAAAMKDLNILGLPTTLLIDSDGRELQRWAGPKEWDSPVVIAEIRGHLESTTTSSRSDTASR
ncbi:TlpA family protein disulfide reductase [Aurantimonas coralicida]|jgi:thiol-disulfide isomerase/thioredoxin|uniref:TlpA family protein disulfide reductase n=1 Tax=Aurantimonas coralicida TaxID=182270 RepID=UPI001D17E978|nr:TlpA disulfide reductase family protein [Aurantimonas coralicida]MCC4300092.1 TlpA family protein disulfide reductase [Aurantimonas coralicida]